MRTKKQLTIIAVVALIISVSLLYGPVATATTPTITTITTSNAKPAVKQSFTLSGILTAKGTPLSNRTIKLGRWNPSGNWSLAGTTTTNSKGAYTFTRSESAQGVYTYQAVFAGDATYASSHHEVSVTVGTLTTTTTTITTSNANPAVNQSFALSGTLTANGTSLSGKTITLGRWNPSGNWSLAGTTTTNSKGAYNFTRRESAQGAYTYQAVFTGGATYASSHAEVSVNVGNLRESALSGFATNYTPKVNQSFTVYGSLQDGVSGTPLAGQPIGLTTRYPSGQIVQIGTTTNSKGAYNFTRRESAQGTYFYYVNFAGSSSYSGSQSMQRVIVGNPIPTKLSLNVTNKNPAVNQSFTISGYLTANGTTLSGMPILVDARLPTGQWASQGQTTTGSNGYYSVTYSEQTSGQYHFEVHFMGNGRYAGVTTTVQVAVGTLQPTKISIKANVTNPGVGKSFTLSGKLTTNGTPLSGKEIDLYRVVVGQSTQQGNIFKTKYTDQNGYYSFVLNEGTRGKYTYTVWFIGDQTHAYSQASVSVTVG